MYRKRMQPEQYFKRLPRCTTWRRRATLRAEPEHRNHHPRLQRLPVVLLVVCGLLLLLGLRASPTVRRQVCSWANLGMLTVGYEYCPATPDPADNPSNTYPQKAGYA